MKTPFDRTEIKNLQLKNRFIRSATWEGLADDRGRVTDRLTNMLVDLARGQVGLIIAGHAFVREDGRATPLQTGIYHDDLIPDLAAMAEAVHQAGGLLAVQPAHSGVQARPEMTGLKEARGPSEIDIPGVTIREFSPGEIIDLAEDFGRAAARARQAGCDAVQIHAAHGYLLSQFLSPLYNQRGDRYGGPIKNRARALFEVYEAVRGAVGEDFPVAVKINCEDFAEGGLTLEDSVWTARNLAEMGLDAVEVSGGLLTSRKLSPSRTKIDAPDKEAYFREQARVFREKVPAPIILVGGLRSLETIEDLVQNGPADYVSLCRPLIREPDLVARWQKGDRRPADCVSCNRCFVSARAGEGISCDMLKKGRGSDPE